MKVCVCVCVCVCVGGGGEGGVIRCLQAGEHYGIVLTVMIACEQALWGALWQWAGKGRRACNYSCTSCNFEYLHQKSLCKMLIGGDDISNDIKHNHIYQHTDWTKIWLLSRWGATGELELEFKFQRRSCKLSFLFPPGELAHRLL